MKYLFTLIVSLLILNNSNAQFRSINSANGIGRLNSSVFSSNRFCGELSAAYMNALVINKQNPASYAQSNLTLIDIGMRAENGTYTLNDTAKNSSGVGLTHIAFLFPLTPGKSGLSLGFTQNSNINYSLLSNNTDATFGKYSNKQTGTGNTYNVYGGVGFKIKKINFGSNINLTFGNIKYNEDIAFTDSTAFPILRNRNDVSLFNLSYDVGTQYYTDLNKKNSLSIGLYYKGNLSASSSDRYTRQSISSTSSTTNLTSTLEDTTQNIDMPKTSKFGIGVNYYSNKTITIGTEFNMTFNDGFKDRFTGQLLQDAWHLHTGLEYRPILNRDVDTRKYFNKATYRLGAVIGKSEQNIEGSLNDLKIMGGISLPVLTRTVSQISLGLEYQKLGFSSNKSYGESILTFVAQITFGDRWFVRPKFD